MRAPLPGHADCLELLTCGFAIGAALSVHHLVQRAFGAWLQPWGQLVEHVDELMDPASLLARRGPDLARRGPEAQRAVTHRYHRRGHPAPLEVAQQRLPALGALPVAILDREQLLLAVGPRADHHQRAEPVVLEPDVEVHPIDPHVNVLATSEIAPAKRRVFFLPG